MLFDSVVIWQKATSLDWCWLVWIILIAIIKRRDAFIEFINCNKLLFKYQYFQRFFDTVMQNTFQDIMHCIWRQPANHMIIPWFVQNRIRVDTIRLTVMWVVDKSNALSVMAITGSQNKISFMKLKKRERKCYYTS